MVSQRHRKQQQQQQFQRPQSNKEITKGKKTHRQNPTDRKQEKASQNHEKEEGHGTRKREASICPGNKKKHMYR